MGAKKSNNKSLITIIIVLIVVIICGAIYFLFFQKKDEPVSGETEETTISAPVIADITDDSDDEIVTKDTLLGKLECIEEKEEPESSYCKIDNTKIRNAREGVTYTLTELTKEDSLASDFEKLADITIDKDDAKQVEIKFNKDIVKRYYNTEGYSYTISVSFDRDVVSTKIAGFGQGVGDEYIFFLMKDETIDILRVSAMLKDKNFNPYRIKGIEKVEAILGGSSYDEYTGGHTNFAIRSDQTAYDLATLLPSWGVEEE